MFACTLASTTYGNGNTYSATYDSLDRVASESYNGVRKYAYSYNKSGNLARETDYENGSKTWWYDYDSSSNLRSIKSSDGKSIKYGFDGSGNKTTVTESDNGTLLSSAAYNYTDDKRISSINLTSMHNGTLNYSYDSLNRLSKKSHVAASWAPTNKINTTYNYGVYAGNQTTLINQIIFQQVDSSSGSDVVTATHGKLNYMYDGNDNITSIKENDVEKAYYQYDGLNQVLSEKNAWLNKTFKYTYDGNGNILSKKEYDYTTNTLTKTINYTYGDSNWKDKLTAYDGKAITYDAIGNPLTYDGYTYTWQKGRELASINGNGKNLTFKYNSSGLRTQKVSGSTTTEYVYSGDQLMSQTNGTDTLSFIYDADGQAIGVSRNGLYYYYMRNVQGDVIALYNCYGDINSRYTYDAWGNLGSVTDANGNAITDPTHIANVNPIRYRGYYYDTETGLYYLQSRYYNPQWGRFLNADDMGVLFEDQGSLIENNLFTYCLNNPVNMYDPTGDVAITTTVVSATISFALVMVTCISLLYTLDPYTRKSVNNAIIWIFSHAASAVSQAIKRVAKSVSDARKKPKTKKTHTHHIVAQRARRAETSRGILKAVGLTTSCRANLVSLNANFHRHLHTYLYHNGVTAMMRAGYKLRKPGVLASLLIMKGILNATNKIFF